MRFEDVELSLVAGSRYLFGLSIPTGSIPDGAGYPSHFRPVPVHVRQRGFASSHLTRRILIQR